LANYSGEFADIKRLYPASLLDDLIGYPFEDTIVSVTSAYDHCLTIQFGDYMVLPQMRDRVPTHGVKNEK
jgi:phosphorylcholine metabolism protein LicD